MGVNVDTNKYPGEFVITNRNVMSYAPPSDIIIRGKHCSRGYIPPNKAARKQGLQALRDEGSLIPFDFPILSKPERLEAIKQMTAEKNLLSDRRLSLKIPSLDQNGTNYCWGNGVVSAIILRRMLMGGGYIPLSPASGCAPITGFRNNGGWGVDFIRYTSKYGINTVNEWPANAIDKRYYTEANKELAKRNMVLKWMELEPGNRDQLMTAMVLRLPVALGYSWWSHEVCGIDPAITNGDESGRIWNSWSDAWSYMGMAVLAANKFFDFDDAVIPVVMSPQHSIAA